MNYKETVDYLYSKLPMFTKVGTSAIKKDLDNTIQFCTSLGNPQQQYKTIHIGGTNGKGSTSHMLAAILQKAGYKTGLYTSPHLKDFRERIRIDGKKVSKNFVKQFIKQNKSLIETIEPSFFEVTVAMAFKAFADEEVDVAIIEVGLGGRLDSTNIIHPDLSIITNISLDHTNILGNTHAEIAFEKAGIIKKNTPVIIGERHPETDAVFIEKAKKIKAPLYFTEDHLKFDVLKRSNNKLKGNVWQDNEIILENLKTDLTGTYQDKNILTVIQAVNILRELRYHISNLALYNALKKVKKITGLQGRWQTLGKKPLIIADTGHNKAGITEIIQNIHNQKFKKLHMVIGMVKDKDISGVLQLLPQTANYYFCAPDLERALNANDLKQQAATSGLKGTAYTSVKAALKAAKNAASEHDLIFVGGSTFVVAEVI